MTKGGSAFLNTETMRLSQELRDRTKKFSSSIIRLFESLPIQRYTVQVLGKQLLRSGTSLAAHTRETSRARSDAEFCSKLDVLLQEADESMLWLEHLEEDCGIPLITYSKLTKSVMS
jgi:four helix bundle protein